MGYPFSESCPKTILYRTVPFMNSFWSQFLRILVNKVMQPNVCLGFTPIPISSTFGKGDKSHRKSMVKQAMNLENTMGRKSEVGRKSFAKSEGSDELGYTKNIIKIDSMMKKEWLSTNLREAKMK